MLALVRALFAAPCRNRMKTMGWFLGHRFNKDTSELMLRLSARGHTYTIPVSDIQILLAGLKLFTAANPWERWAPAEDPHTVIDLGGNLGLSSLYFASRFPAAKIVAVEMMPENASAIRRLATLNGVTIEVANIAVGSSDGIATIQLNESHSRHRLAQLKGHESRDLGQEFGFIDRTSTVPISRLGTLITRLDWKTVDLLKVDIEGAEQLLLNDIKGWADSVSTVFLEVHHNVDPREAEALMIAHSFNKVGQDTEDRTELWFSK
jgi:FkbM family methyltransferase